ncbi:MAG: thioesterase family protein [Thermoleophilaceae bacterium]
MPEYAFDFEVEGPLLTDVGGTLPSPVLSTPGMVAMMERAATVCAASELPAGGYTVGFEICVKHIGAVPEGTMCTAKAVLREVVDERKFRFDVEVRDGERLIGTGTHERRMPKSSY